jgi:hypothetical protein
VLSVLGATYSAISARDYGVPRCAAGRNSFREVPGDLPVSTLRMLIGVAAAVAVLGRVLAVAVTVLGVVIAVAIAVAAPCVTLTVIPAILIVDDRALVPVLAGTV